MSNVTFEQVKPLIEQMPSAEVERLRAWLNSSTTDQTNSASDSMTWGERLVALVNQFDLGEGDQMEITDPETWVRERRTGQTQKRNAGWGAE